MHKITTFKVRCELGYRPALDAPNDTPVPLAAVMQNGSGATQRFSFSGQPTLEDIRRMQAEFTDERDWNQFHQPRNLLLAMVGEVGEVCIRTMTILHRFYP